MFIFRFMSLGLFKIIFNNYYRIKFREGLEMIDFEVME